MAYQPLPNPLVFSAIQNSSQASKLHEQVLLLLMIHPSQPPPQSPRGMPNLIRLYIAPFSEGFLNSLGIY